ncbi:MAG: protein kinase [Clostridia bacterium]|nr:protein kinase [Clostridia bacterium]
MEITDKYTDQTIHDIRESDKVSAMPSFMCRWEIDSRIGHGSFGSVYKITKISSNAGKPSALKVISVDSDDNVDFAHEVQILQSLESTHLTHIEDFDEVSSADGKRHYLLIRMELLNKLPRDNMSVDEVVNMGRQICSVLSVCHNSKPPIIHRDIKPDNIMVNDSGIYKLGDFGSSRIMDKNQAMTSIGTPYYMPPEIAAFKDYDHRADIYSLAVTMYVLLNKGKHPFTDTSTDKEQAIRRRMSGERLPDIPGAPPALVEALRRATNPEPAYRYNTVEEFSRAIDSALHQPMQVPVMPVPQPIPGRPIMPQPQPVPSAWPVRQPVAPMPIPVAPMPRPMPQPMPPQPVQSVMPQRNAAPPVQQSSFSASGNGAAPNAASVSGGAAPYNSSATFNTTVQPAVPAFGIALTSIILGAFGLFLLFIALCIADLTVSFIGLIFSGLSLICTVLAKSQGNRSGMITTGTIMAGVASVLFLLSLMVSSC